MLRFDELQFPIAECYSDDLCDYITDDLLYLDTFAAPFINKYKTSEQISMNDMIKLDQMARHLYLKLKKLEKQIDVRDKKKYKEVELYLLELMKNINLIEIRFPRNSEQIQHIFRADASGHFKNTSENCKWILDTANNKGNFIASDKFGNKQYGAILKDGRQIWVETRNGEIRNAGYNCNTPNIKG